ncbi:MAG: tetratricopeptide repeat protein [Candidatus Wallbacteria bacterium]
MYKEMIIVFLLIAMLVNLGNAGYAQAAANESQALIQKYEKYVAEGDYQEAKRALIKALAEDPKNIQIKNNLGTLHIMLGDYGKALDQFEEILKLNPEYANAYINIGIIMSRKGDYEKAIKVLKQGLALNPDSAVAHYNLGLSIVGLEKYQDGINELKLALQIDPKYSEAQSALGEVYFTIGNRIEANNYLLKAVLNNPKNYTALNTLGLLNLNQAKFDTAIEFFNKAMKGPRQVQVIASYNLALAYLGKNDVNKAVASFKKATELEPGLAPAYNDWGIVLLRQDNPKEASELFIKAITIEPKNKTFNFNLIEAYIQLKLYNEAIELCNFLIKLDPKCAQAYDTIGHINYINNNYQQAKSNYEKAIQADPSYAEAHYHLGVLYDKSNLSEKASGEYLNAIKLNPKHIMAYNNLGFGLMNNLKLDEAAKYLEEAIKLDPNFTFSLYNLGITYFNRNKGDDMENAKKMFSKILEIESKNSNFYKLAEDAIKQIDKK